MSITPPKAEIVDYDGVSYLSYTVNVSAENVQADIMQLLDLCFEEWMQRSFSGKVWLKALNPNLEGAALEAMRTELDTTVSQAQQVVNENGFSSAEGNPITLMYSIQ